MRKLIIAVLLAYPAAGCHAPRDYYIKSETGPHGVVTTKKIYYTPEELAAREQAQREVRGLPTDDQMIEIEKLWPRLTEQQRQAVLKTVQEMAGQQ